MFRIVSAILIAVMLSLLCGTVPVQAAPRATMSIGSTPEGIRSRVEFVVPQRSVNGQRRRPSGGKPLDRIFVNLTGVICPVASEEYGPADCLQRVPAESVPADSSGSVSVYDLVLQAESQASFPAVTLRLRPDLLIPDGRSAGLVGVPTWFWLDAMSWQPLSIRAQAGPVWVSVTATPAALSIFPGDGAAVACTGPGTPLVDHTQALRGSPDCGYTYTRVSTGQPDGAYVVTAAVTWTLRWQASTQGHCEVGNVLVSMAMA